ncbi:class I SAM-dependent methyltransferase [Streptomyces sp. NPDC002004]
MTEIDTGEDAATGIDTGDAEAEAGTRPGTEPEHLTRTRSFYDAVAGEYADRYRDWLEAQPLERAVLGGFAGLVLEDGGGRPVAEVGCGPGRATSYLHGLGLPVFGIDLSPRMVALARAAHPEIRFEVGSMLELDLADGSLGGIAAWYSVIHLPEDRLPDAFDEFRRVLAPGGHVLVAFQVGDEPLHLDRPFGHPVSLDFRRHRPERIAELLDRAGLSVHARMVREPADDTETTPQAFLIARRPVDDA